MPNLEINQQVKVPEPLPRAFFANIFKAFINHCRLADFKVSLALVTPATIKKLNRQYRGNNKVTDVLSFEELNEIFLCPAYIYRQSLKSNKSFKQELAFIFVHGLLHLKGYDHQTVKQEASMTNLTMVILTKVRPKIS